MSQINSTELLKGLRDTAKIQNSESVPSNLASAIVPVIETSPHLVKPSNIAYQATSTNATATTVLTVPAGYDFYITAASLTLLKDVTATTTIVTLRARLEEALVNSADILAIGSITLTVHNATVSNSFPHPIKVMSGRNIQIISGTNVGNFVATACVVGYFLPTQV
jgi:hypothetical protein